MNATLEQPKTIPFPPLPTRCIKDFQIPDDAIHADAELSKRMDECAMQLVRLSLLGIAGYGFLIKEIAVGSTSGLEACQKSAIFIIGGAACLVLSLGLAFWARELQVRCSGLQIAILRTFGKLENGGWSEDQVGTLKASLKSYRAEQRNKLDWNRRSMRMAHMLLAIGAASAVVCFFVVLRELKPESKSERAAISVSQQVGTAGKSGVH